MCYVWLCWKGVTYVHILLKTFSFILFVLELLGDPGVLVVDGPDHDVEVDIIIDGRERSLKTFIFSLFVLELLGELGVLVVDGPDHEVEVDIILDERERSLKTFN